MSEIQAYMLCLDYDIVNGQLSPVSHWKRVEKVFYTSI